ncbi:CRISPR-associated protein Cas4 [uncultured Bifidobacterium sp.]|uniref:CRISPR-associated protein Cas4 n=1 Tax=uncultured Bifidobacterium sp. TaxID=165187 RepID=UPI002596E198|nr:CRISPR-associated protein Cas4 [uncultured Bifidobacterium sp.]
MNMFGRTAKRGLDGYPEDSWLALSGIQHFAFCPRQWALIHIEQQWTENYLTMAGLLEHERAHDYQASEKRGDVLILRNLRVFSRGLGVSGDCDVVEFRADASGVSLAGREGLWRPYPVEYKHGKPKTNDADRMQLCAEAMCLEEMLACDIEEGALFYQRTKHRESVRFDDGLRGKVRKAYESMHNLMAKGYTPKAHKTKACNACSLKEVCLPELDRTESVSEYIRAHVDEGKQ